MNQYITGNMIRKLREERKITQLQLAEKLNVSDKTISKWETGRGYPDIALIEPLAAALNISILELLSGENITNTNRSFNMNRLNFYICPICGNVIFSSGEAVVSCCGITLPAAEAETLEVGGSSVDGEHFPHIEKIEDEYYIQIPHEMSKSHYISFIAAIKDNGCEIIKLYPEGAAEARFKVNRTQWICFYCNQHGLFKVRAKALLRPQA